MSVQLKVNSVDASSSVDWLSINLNLVLTKEVSTLNFDVLKTPSATIPAVGDQIDAYDDSGHIFGGTVTETELKIDGGILARYSITAVDWSYQFDSKNVVQTYTDMDPGAIVQDIIENFTTGFTDTNVQLAGFNIPSVKFNYQPPTKCIQKIAALIGWDWYIDADKDVHFFLGDIADGGGDGTTAPFNLDDTSGNLDWPSIDYLVNAQNLKNSVFVIGATYKKTYDATSAIDVYKSVAGQTTYSLVYPYDPDTMTVTLDDVSQTVGTYGKDDPVGFDVLYSNTSGTRPFIAFTTDPGDGHTLKIFGDAEVPILGYANDTASIAAYGEFQDTIVDKQITTVTEAQQRALAEILQYGNPINDLKFNTLKTGLMIGQAITLNSTILGLNVTLTIQRMRAIGYSPTQLKYQVEAIGGDKVGFVDLMAVLLEQELNQNSVDDTTILQVLLRIAETVPISDDTPAISTSTGPYTWDNFDWNFGTWS
ncbi:MAG TPA: hypothetical protein VHY35_06375 [Stellaceae bacterium]|jgi:hypothetical protein|nr:hypothetical protein [Stellaceae bacterium]